MLLFEDRTQIIRINQDCHHVISTEPKGEWRDLMFIGEKYEKEVLRIHNEQYS